MSTHNIPISIYIYKKKKKITLNYSKSAAMEFCRGIKDEFETGMVNESSVCEPSKFYCRIK